MAKSLIMIGIGKPSKLPPKFGKREEAERQAEAYSPSPSPSPDAEEESPEYEQEAHNLQPGAKFPAENVHYHTSQDQCDGCHHWAADTSSCKVVAMATDPGGWCSLFPGEYAEHELTEKPGEEESTESDGSDMAEAA